MRLSIVRFIVSLCALTTVLTAGPANADQNSSTITATPNYQLERLDWQQLMNRGDTLVVENPWGDIRIAQNGNRQAVFHAVMQKIGSAPKVAKLRTQHSPGRTVLSVYYPPKAQPHHPAEGRVDASILIPEEVNLEIHAERGRIIGKRLNSPLMIRSAAAPINIISAGALDIETIEAEVQLLLLPGTTAQHGLIHTQSGNIIVNYRPQQALRLMLRSGSSITTDDLALLRSRHHHQEYTIMHRGEHPARLQLQSDTGHIILHQFSDD